MPSNILFICGGAFGGIEKIIQNRMGHKVIGFGAESHSKLDKTNDELLRSLMPQDLLKYGLIPEFIGRLPVVVTLDNLELDFSTGPASVSPVQKGNNAALAHAALQELGYSAAEINAALKGVDPKATTEEMVRYGLRQMVMKG